MGILNVTPDSFYDGGKFNSEQFALQHVEKMVQLGVDMVDIGGYSSRPGAEHISEADEYDRVIPSLSAIKREFPDLVISVDTFRSGIAREAVQAGATMVNDISGGNMDDNMFVTIAELRVPYILMHMRGTPQTMQGDVVYSNLIEEIIDYLLLKINELRALGVHDIVVDPGFGFGKSLDSNYELLHRLNSLSILDQPILAGLSRKSMIGKLLGNSEEQTLKGTMALNLVALLGGASILRVHDVGEAKEMVSLFLRLTAQG